MNSNNTGITPLTPGEQALAESQVTKEGYIKRNLIAFDQFANVLLDGANDETISSRAARWATHETGAKGAVGKIVSKALDLFEKDHGARAEAGDLQRAETVEQIENHTGTLPTEE